MNFSCACLIDGGTHTQRTRASERKKECIECAHSHFFSFLLFAPFFGNSHARTHARNTRLNNHLIWLASIANASNVLVHMWIEMDGFPLFRRLGHGHGLARLPFRWWNATHEFYEFLCAVNICCEAANLSSAIGAHARARQRNVNCALNILHKSLCEELITKIWPLQSDTQTGRHPWADHYTTFLPFHKFHCNWNSRARAGLRICTSNTLRSEKKRRNKNDCYSSGSITVASKVLSSFSCTSSNVRTSTSTIANWSRSILLLPADEHYYFFFNLRSILFLSFVLDDETTTTTHCSISLSIAPKFM